MKLFELKFDSPLHVAAGRCDSLLYPAVGSQILPLQNAAGSERKLPGNISPLHDAAVRFHSPLHDTVQWGVISYCCMMQLGIKSYRCIKQRGVGQFGIGEFSLKTWKTP